MGQRNRGARIAKFFGAAYLPVHMAGNRKKKGGFYLHLQTANQLHLASMQSGVTARDSALAERLPSLSLALCKTNDGQSFSTLFFVLRPQRNTSKRRQVDTLGCHHTSCCQEVRRELLRTLVSIRNRQLVQARCLAESLAMLSAQTGYCCYWNA